MGYELNGAFRPLISAVYARADWALLGKPAVARGGNALSAVQ